MPDKVIEVQGIEELEDRLNKIPEKIKQLSSFALDKVCDQVATNIQATYRGGSSPGFKDRTGALRGSIRGSFLSYEGEDVAVGFVGAGDDMIGSNGKKTKDYVEMVEFGEFSRAGNTSFLRAGVQKLSRSIAEMIAKEFDIESLI